MRKQVFLTLLAVELFGCSDSVVSFRSHKDRDKQETMSLRLASQTATTNWHRELHAAGQRISPATCNASNGDRCESFADALDQTNNSRIQIVVKKPQLSNDAPILVTDANNNGVLEELVHAIAQAQTRNSGQKIVIQPGTYFAPRQANCGTIDAHLCLSDLTDLDINGQGSTLVFRNQFLLGIAIEDSQRIALRNLRLDWEYQPGLRGRIVSTPKGAGIRIFPPTGVASVPAHEIDSILGYSFADQSWYVDDGRKTARLNFETEEVSPFEVVSAADSIFYLPAFDVLSDAYPVGSDVMVLRNRRIPGATPEEVRRRVQTVQIRGRGANDISFENINVYNSPQTAFSITSAGRGLHFKNVRFTAGANSDGYLATRGGGIVVIGSEGDIVIEGTNSISECNAEPRHRDCAYFENMGDDGVNITGGALAVAAAAYNDTNGVIVVRFNTNLPLPENDLNTGTKLQNVLGPQAGRAGDRMAFIVEQQRPVGVADVISAQYETATKTLTLRMRAASGTNAARLVEELNSAARPPIAFNLSLSSSRSLIRNVWVRSTSGRGFIVQAPNSLVERNRVHEAVMGGIHLRYSHSAFVEGPGATNVVVRNNQIKKVATLSLQKMWRGGISVGTEGFDGSTNQYQPLVRDLVIRDNVIDVSRGTGIQAISSANLDIRSNTIQRTDFISDDRAIPDYLNPRGEIYLDRVNGARVIGNSCDAVLCREVDVVSEPSTSNIQFRPR